MKVSSIRLRGPAAEAGTSGRKVVHVAAGTCPVTGANIATATSKSTATATATSKSLAIAAAAIASATATIAVTTVALGGIALEAGSPGCEVVGFAAGACPIARAEIRPTTTSSKSLAIAATAAPAAPTTTIATAIARLGSPALEAHTPGCKVVGSAFRAWPVTWAHIAAAASKSTAIIATFHG
eukprot:CAMPEP_0174282684 /NCGR_PEP_ID=MMETSP0809-20121228/3238_1 /TAXON_ID=73025 ORGANISM="Eutreptiella gymnastica-like, Strain CCMP1594" /NCGR_SAMPLE_ID=MMETSP0809 /ASSEMBLY_ACC=CAM_ASM_000658 /LENGTH=182 /DNA_ID=CAMNT_0015377071 /DNA_START=104 /DNA_END=652 /DNA_ORIENTATION=-